MYGGEELQGLDKAGDATNEPLVPSTSQTYLPLSLQTPHTLFCTPTLFPSTPTHYLKCAYIMSCGELLGFRGWGRL